MGVSPDVLDAAPRSRVLDWLYYSRERSLVEEYRAEEALFRAQRGRTH